MLRYFAVLLLLVYPVLATQAQTTAGDPERGKKKAQSCAACHGADGNSSNPAWPKLAGQHPDYIVTQLKAFKSGARNNPQMSPMAEGLSEEDMQDLAAYYSSQKMSLDSVKPEFVDTAETLYRAGKAEAGMPACIACHGPKGDGVPGVAYPRIGGQHADYTAAQLKAYRSGERQGGQAQVMQDIAKHLTDAEIQALASYISGLH